MDKFPLLWSGRPAGELATEKEPLYTWFTARCHLPEEGLWCAWAVGEQGELRREEAFLLLVGRLLERCGGCPRPPEEVRPEVRAVCDYLEAHCDRRITLEQLSTLAGLSKYHLLRCFTRQKGITPYRYLETVRVNRARALLEQGATPLDAALRAGFADQSHFNHFFKILTGLTPSQYRAVFAAERGEP